MKKIILLLGVFAAIFVMVSSATAVPQVQSQPVIEKVNRAEKLRAVFENIKIQKGILDTENSDGLSDFIDFIKSILISVIIYPPMIIMSIIMWIIIIIY